MTSAHPLAAVIGLPTAHSLSPTIHGYWLRRHGLAGSYAPIEIAAADLPAFFELAPRIGFRGFNVTAPHKEAAYRLCDRHSERARRAQSVNLVVFDEEGVVGDSTDGFGFLANLEDETGFEARGKKVALLGAGGAARAVADALVEAGVAEIRIANRTAARATAVANLFGDRARVTDDWPAPEAFFEGVDLVVHATTYGMKGDVSGSKPWRLPTLSPDSIAAELIYTPLETPFLRDAKAAGARPVDGLGMLLHQARPCFEAWFHARVEVDAGLRQEIIRVLDERGEAR